MATQSVEVVHNKELARSLSLDVHRDGDLFGSDQHPSALKMPQENSADAAMARPVGQVERA